MPRCGRAIDEHGIIGNGRSAALVALDGSIDWLCWPRFDSPSLFAALLDEHRGGEWRIAPTQPFQSTHAYVENTNVLDTCFRTARGMFRVRDLMPVSNEAHKTRHLEPEHELVRIVEGLEGEVEVEVRFAPRPHYGRDAPTIRDRGPHGLVVEHGRQVYVLRGELELQPTAAGIFVGHARVSAGETLAFSLAYSSEAPAVLPVLGDRVRETVERTCHWWRDWTSRARYSGPYRAEVIRSLLALKLLSFAPSGGIIAAPTSSLPERVGGDLNWDYRYVWLRDAAFTIRVLLALGYDDDAEAFVSWLLHTTRLTRPELNVLYDVYGDIPSGERELDHLAGYASSRPVRIGNAAASQLQLDAYGEVLDAATMLVRRGLRFDRETQRMLRDFGTFVCKHWERPDSGIWEPRGEPQEFTHSRVLCWVALDRLLELCDTGVLSQGSIPVERFRRNRALLQLAIEERGWSDTLGSYVQTFDGDTLDASLLLMSWYGYRDPGDARMRRTHRRVAERLRAGDDLLYRYEQSLEAGEGAFTICSFWEAEFLARGSQNLDGATACFEAVLRRSNALGLLAEEIDPKTGAQIGNFPQAFSHVGLISAALALEERGRELESRPPVGRQRTHVDEHRSGAWL